VEVGAAGGDGEEDAARVIGGHAGHEVGRGFALGPGLLAASFHEQTVGQACTVSAGRPSTSRRSRAAWAASGGRASRRAMGAVG